MGRWLLNAITLLSLALCGAGMVFYALGAGGAMVFWRGNSWHEGVMQHEPPNSGFRLGLAGPGGVTLRGWQVGVGENSVRIWDWRSASAFGEPVLHPYVDEWYEPDLPSARQSTWLRFGWDSFSWGRFEMRRATAPLWFLTLAAGLLPGVRLYRWQRRRCRHRPGHCAQCGYDLRATPDRCPECGMVPKQCLMPKD